jgi:hypothetical protein
MVVRNLPLQPPVRGGALSESGAGLCPAMLTSGSALCETVHT